MHIRSTQIPNVALKHKIQYIKSYYLSKNNQFQLAHTVNPYQVNRKNRDNFQSIFLGQLICMNRILNVQMNDKLKQVAAVAIAKRALQCQAESQMKTQMSDKNNAFLK